MPYLRTFTVAIPEEERQCCHCKKDLAGKESQLYIIAPDMDRCFEFCSWACLYKYVVALLKAKIMDRKLADTDILKQLGLRRKWGMKLSEADLTSPINDPIEDSPKDYK